MIALHHSCKAILGPAIAQRKSNADIATRLVLSSKTVRNYDSNILSKYQVADRTEAMCAGWTAGLEQEDDERTSVCLISWLLHNHVKRHHF